MKSAILVFSCLLVLLSCKKTKLDGELEPLQGKWQWIGATEIRENKVTGAQSESWISSADYTNKYFFEFERKGKVSFWLNEKEEKFYRIEFVNSDNFCDFNLVADCNYFAINLNFKIENQLKIFTNEDTMKVISTATHVPLQSYEDQVASYTYVHTFVRIN